MKKHNGFPALAVAFWIMAGSTVTEANAYSGKGGSNMERLMKGLNLTTEQKYLTEEIVHGHQSDLITGKMAVLRARQNLLGMLHGNRLDEQDMRAAYSALSAAEEKLTILRARILQEVMPVLTPDQQEAIREKVAKMSLRTLRSMIKLESKLSLPQSSSQRSESVEQGLS